MKISLHIEADSAEELKGFFEMFHVKQFEVEAPITDAELKELMQEDTARVAAITAKSPPEEPSEVQKQARKPRGPNKPKIEVAPVEPVIQPPVGPSPVIEMPKPVKAKEPPEEVLSRQDLLDVFNEYVTRYGVSFGYTDVSNLLQQHLGNGVRKASDVTEESIPVAIGVIKTAITDNPFNRKRDYNA